MRRRSSTCLPARQHVKCQGLRESGVFVNMLEFQSISMPKHLSVSIPTCQCQRVDLWNINCVHVRLTRKTSGGAHGEFTVSPRFSQSDPGEHLGPSPMGDVRKWFSVPFAFWYDCHLCRRHPALGHIWSRQPRTHTTPLEDMLSVVRNWYNRKSVHIYLRKAELNLFGTLNTGSWLPPYATALWLDWSKCRRDCPVLWRGLDWDPCVPSV